MIKGANKIGIDICVMAHKAASHILSKAFFKFDEGMVQKFFLILKVFLIGF